MLSFVVTMAPSYSAPAVVGRAARAAVSMNVADLPGAGEETLGKVFDPLGLSDMQPYGSANQEWMRTAEVHAHGARARPRAAAATAPPPAAQCSELTRPLSPCRRSSTVGSA